MLNICIIDDEFDARILLREMLIDMVPDCRIIGEADSRASAIELLQNVKPDAVFLDIDLKDGTGFEVLAALPPPQYAIVFATAFNQFAIKAFQVNALDYLLKPVGSDELKRVVDKIRNGQSSTDFQKQIAELLATNKNRKADKLVLHTAEGVHFLPIADIIRLESAGSYTTIETIKGEKIMVSSNLGNFDHLTSDFEINVPVSELFFRIHQSHIIRISMVKQLLKQSDGDFVVLNTGIKIPIARRRKEAFLAAMNG